MTRVEAEAIAARLVTVEDDSWESSTGAFYTGWIIRVAGRTVEEDSVRAALLTRGDERCDVWRAAIVRALLDDGVSR